ncbi:hypothetical protein ACROYT_G041546 [Oculina patagonica]
MVSTSKSTGCSPFSLCSGNMRKKFVLYLFVVTWAAIFFVSGTLFLRRRYESTKLQLEALTSLQEQIDDLSSKVSEDKSSATDVIKTLHEKINLTLSSLDRKISDLETEFSERRYRAMQALHALHGGMTPTVKDERTEQAAASSVLQEDVANEQEAAPSALLRKNEVKSSANGMCVDSMEQPVGRDVELYNCHGQGGNQAWGFSSFNSSSGLIENKVIHLCLWSVGSSEGNPVRTAVCNDSDSQQKWKHVDGLIMLENGQNESKCLDFGAISRKLMIRLCDSTEKTQHWIF